MKHNLIPLEQRLRTRLVCACDSIEERDAVLTALQFLEPYQRPVQPPFAQWKEEDFI